MGSIVLIVGLIFGRSAHWNGQRFKRSPKENTRAFGIDVDDPYADYNIRHAKAAIMEASRQGMEEWNYDLGGLFLNKKQILFLYYW